MGLIQLEPGHVDAHLFQVFQRDVHSSDIDHAGAHFIFRIVSDQSLRDLVSVFILIEDLRDGRTAIGHAGHGR